MILNELSLLEIDEVSGGFIWQGAEMSMNVVDCRSGSCWDMNGIPMTQDAAYAFDP
jgi:hypothetical protein